MPRKNNYTTDAARRLGYRSGFESDVAEELEQLSIPFEYESVNCKFEYLKPIRNGYCSRCTMDGKVYQTCEYTCDFYINTDHRLQLPMWIETKGRFTSSDRTKMERIKENYGDSDIRILFQYNGKATPKRSYVEWCEWKGIKCAVIDKKNKRYIPREWLEELGVK